jgi:hypothetical protein
MRPYKYDLIVKVTKILSGRNISGLSEYLITFSVLGRGNTGNPFKLLVEMADVTETTVDTYIHNA